MLPTETQALLEQAPAYIHVTVLCFAQQDKLMLLA